MEHAILVTKYTYQLWQCFFKNHLARYLVVQTYSCCCRISADKQLFPNIRAACLIKLWAKNRSHSCGVHLMKLRYLCIVI